MEGPKNKYVSHLVGIVPIQNGPTNDGLPWPKSLTPLYNNYTALHRAVLECAMVGCSSIWVVVEKRHIPLMKAVVGSYVEDPILAQLPVEFKENFTMKIPIWYVSLPVRDLGRRDCYGRSILAGADYALNTASKLSEKLKPEKFYVAFTESVYSPWILQNHRKKVKSIDKNIFLTIENKSIKDGVPVGFSMFREDLQRYNADFKSRDQGAWMGTTVKDLKRRPLEERNTASKLTLDEVFRSATMDGAVVQDLTNAFNISTWEGYAKYMASNKFYRMPKKVKYFRFNKTKDLETRLIDCGDEDVK
jgi:hypothetical protein